MWKKRCGLISFVWLVNFDQSILKWSNTLSGFKRDFQTEQKSCIQNNSDAEIYHLPREYLFIYLYQSKFWSLPANFVTWVNLRKYRPYLSRVRNRQAMSHLEPVGKLLWCRSFFKMFIRIIYVKTFDLTKLCNDRRFPN